MTTNGIFPASGVAADQANNAYQAALAAVMGCVIRYYGRGRCRQQVDFDALNGLMANMLAAIDQSGQRYDCGEFQLPDAIRRLAIICRSQITGAAFPGYTGYFPPHEFISPLVIDDNPDSLAETGGVPPVYSWDCTTEEYRLINPQASAASVVKCFSQLAITSPPAGFVANILVDDRTSPPIIWWWNCTTGAYERQGGATRFTRTYLGAIVIGGNAANTAAMAPIWIPASNAAYPNMNNAAAPTPLMQADGFMDPNSWKGKTYRDNGPWGSAGDGSQGPDLGDEILVTAPFDAVSASLNGSGGTTSDQSILFTNSKFGTASDYFVLPQDILGGGTAMLQAYGLSPSGAGAQALTQYAYNSFNKPRLQGWQGKEKWLDVTSKTAVGFRIAVPFVLSTPQPWFLGLSVYG